MKKGTVQILSLVVGAACIALVGCRSMAERRAMGGVGSAADYVDSTLPHRAMVWRIEGVSAALDHSDPAQIVAQVRAEAVSSGWTNPEFVPFVYTAPPKDGIYEFVLTAEEPGGVIAQRMTPFEAKLIWRNPPRGVKGIRIHAVENRKEDRL